MAIPLYGFVEGDTLGLLVLAGEDERVGDLGRRLQDAASLRVAPSERFQVVVEGEAIDLELTVSQAGLAPLGRIDVRRDETKRA